MNRPPLTEKEAPVKRRRLLPVVHNRVGCEVAAQGALRLTECTGRPRWRLILSCAHARDLEGHLVRMCDAHRIAAYSSEAACPLHTAVALSVVVEEEIRDLTRWATRRPS